MQSNKEKDIIGGKETSPMNTVSVSAKNILTTEGLHL